MISICDKKNSITFWTNPNHPFYVINLGNANFKMINLKYKVNFISVSFDCKVKKLYCPFLHWAKSCNIQLFATSRRGSIRWISPFLWLSSNIFLLPLCFEYVLFTNILNKRYLFYNGSTNSAAFCALQWMFLPYPFPSI